MNKAREFEDFILDEYDYNLLEDWDLEYLWEWVEFEDFADLQNDFNNSHNFDPDGDTISDDNEYHDDNDDNDNDNDDNEYDDDDDEYDFNFDFDDDDDDDDDDEYDEDDDDDDNEYDDDNQTDTHTHTIQSDDEEDLEGDAFLRSIGLLDDDDEEDNDNDDDDEDEDADNEDDAHYVLGGPRFIETSAGTIDLALDDILVELQKVEFDEFIDVLKRHNYVYDKILTQQEWSEEEIEFLQSIEPLVRDTKTLENVQHKEQQKQKTKSNPPTPISHTLIETQTYPNLKEMFDDLAKKSFILARNNQHKVQYTPKNMNKMWNIDTEDKRAERVKLLFGEVSMSVAKDTLQPQMNPVRNHIPMVINGKNEARYLELKEILTNEIHTMSASLDNTALGFIKQDGKRFGMQFMDFLVQKYGSKIYYLYQSQLKNDISADRLSQDLFCIISENLKFDNLDIFLTAFFESILITLEQQGIEF